jgi:hypothetical protein
VAQANSNTALLDSQSTFYTSGQTYQPAATMITALDSSEPNLTFQTTASTNHSQVSLYVANDHEGIIFAVQSNTKKDCWYTIINAKAETTATGGSPYSHLPSSVLGIGTSYGESKVPASGVVPTCIANSLASPSATVSYQKGSFPTL